MAENFRSDGSGGAEGLMLSSLAQDARFRIALLASGTIVLLAIALTMLHPDSVRAYFDALQSFRQSAADAVLATVPGPAILAHALATWTRGVLLAPHLLAPCLLILAAESLWPARQQPVLSPALANDFVWYLAEIGFFLAALGSFAQTLATICEESLGLGALHAAVLPLGLKVAVAVICSDFLDWLHHLVRHRVTAFWWFHTVHHAQRQLNLWTNERVHIVDAFISAVIRVVPATLLGIGPFGIVSYVIVAAWYTRLYHANIRSNFGPLRYLLVTPQSHRVHHSLLPEHQNKNFGVIFSVWDHIFGTQCRDYEVFPPTGIADESFPHELTWAQTLSLRTFIAQQLFPLRLAWRWLNRRRLRVAGAR